MHNSVRRVLCATIATLGLLAVPGLASAATGSYTANTWTFPGLNHARIWGDSSLISPPAGVPANATVTSINAFINWESNPPFGTVYSTRICDYNTLVCLNSGTTSGNNWSISGWTGWAGKPAATWTFKISAEIDDFSTSTIHQVYNPTRYTNARSVTVNYSY
jgi:hypothetical protein